MTQNFIYLYTVGCFYLTIGNLKPYLRSSIQIFALAEVNKISKYGIAKVLDPIVEDITKLEQVHNYPHCIRNNVLMVHTYTGSDFYCQYWRN